MLPVRSTILGRLSVSAVLAFASISHAQKAATTTTLALTSSGNPVTSVPPNTPLTLTATVTSPGNTTRGEVRFCDDAVNTSCAGSGFLGSAQIQPNGNARLVVRLAIGSHQIKAIYHGINTLASSTSMASTFTVSGSVAGSLGVTFNGAPGSYTLTGRLTADLSKSLVPVGTVQFLDTSYGNRIAGSAPLAISKKAFVTDNSSLDFNFSNPAKPFVAIGDFNNDGLLETFLLCPQQGPAGHSYYCSPSSATTANFSVADLNRDGNLDVIESDLANGSYYTSVFYGNGDGTFKAGVLVDSFQNGPGGAVVGDFDGDGFLDILGRSGGVTAWGKGDGTFDFAYTDITPSSYSFSPIVGVPIDLNGDGITDVLTTAGPILASSARKFTSSGTSTSQQLILGDFNADGTLDNLSIQGSLSRVEFRNSDGTQTYGPTFAAPSQTGVYLVGDWDGDGHLDFALFDQRYDNVTQTERLSITPYMGDGAGNFTPGEQYIADPIHISTSTIGGIYGYSLDMDHDGRDEIKLLGNMNGTLSMRIDQSGSTANISLPEPGTHVIKAFIPASGSFPDTYSTSSVTLNGSGQSTGTGSSGTTATSTTLAVTSNGSPVTTVAAGAKIVFTSTTTSQSAGVTGTVYVCDLAINSACSNAALIASGQMSASGTFTYSTILLPGTHSLQARYGGTTVFQNSASSPVAFTVTGGPAALMGIAVSGTQGNYTLRATVSGNSPTGTVQFLDTSNGNVVIASAQIVPGTASATVAPVTTSTTLSNDKFRLDKNGLPRSYANLLGDFNRDGNIDYLSTDANGVNLNLGNGDGTYRAPTNIAGAIGTTIGDFDGDGFLDVAGASQGNLVVCFGKGDGTFSAPVTVATRSDWFGLDLVADLNGDGISDIVSGTTAFLGKSDRTMTSVASTMAHPSTSLKLIALIDVNGDGKPDQLRSNGSFGSNAVAVNLGNGDGTFGDTSFFSGSGASGHFQDTYLNAALADFNGDGKVDIALTDIYYPQRVDAINGYANVELLLFPGNSDGTFGPAQFIEAGSYGFYGRFFSASVDDVDGDGIADIVYPSDGTFISPYTRFSTSASTATATGVSVSGSGSHIVSATYVGDSANPPLTSSNTVTLQGGKTTPGIALTPSSSTNQYSASITLTAALLNTGGAASATDGEVMTFSVGGTTLGTATLTNGVAFIRVSNLPVGTYTPSVSYPGDANLQGTVASGVSFTVTKATPAIVWAAPSAIQYPTALSSTQLNAVARDLQGNSVAGTFTYLPVAGTVLELGTQTLSVHFTPADTANFSEADGSVNLTVNKGTATITTSGPSTVTSGSNFTYTNTVSGGGVVPTGTILVREDNSTFTSVLTLSNGTASGTSNFQSPGQHQIAFTYSGDAHYAPSGPVTYTVTASSENAVITWPAPSAITWPTPLGASQLNATFANGSGQPLAGTATYTPPAGTVLEPGQQTISVHFVPTNTAISATDKATNITINKAATTISVTGPNTVTTNTPATFTVTVPGIPGHIPTGMVTLTNGQTTSSPVTLVNGTASVPFTFTASGTAQITAQYAGDAHFAVAATQPFAVDAQKPQPVLHWTTPAPITYGTALSSAQLNATATNAAGQSLPGSFAYSPAAGTVLQPGTQTLSVVFTPSDLSTYSTASQTVSLVVSKAPSSVSIVQTSPVSVGVGTSVNTTFTASVTSSLGTPTGTVTFFDGTAQLGSATLASGVAHVTTSFTTTGTHPITATYSGDGLFLGATSSVFNETVVVTGLSLVASPSSMTIHQGSTGTSVITVTPTGNYTGKLDLSCSGLPSLATCAFSPSSIVMAGDNAVQTSTLTISTRGPGVGSLRSNARNGIQLAAIFGLPAMFWIGYRRRRAALPMLLSLMAILILSVGSAGCGVPANVTPTGTSTVKVTAQASATSGAAAQNQTLNINVTIVQ